MNTGHLIARLKDLTSMVLPEALGQGLPVICPDHCGFADVVTSECGVKIPVTNVPQMAADTADAIQTLDADENHRASLAQGALRRIGESSWEKKARQMDRIYREAVTRSNPQHPSALA